MGKIRIWAPRATPFETEEVFSSDASKLVGEIRARGDVLTLVCIDPDVVGRAYLMSAGSGRCHAESGLPVGIERRLLGVRTASVANASIDSPLPQLQKMIPRGLLELRTQCLNPSFGARIECRGRRG